MRRDFYKYAGLVCVSLFLFVACRSNDSNPGGLGSDVVLSGGDGGASGSLGGAGAGGARATDDAGAGGAAAEQSCAESRSALSTKIRQSTGCAEASDCVEYDAACVQQESGNCAGIFYIAKSQKDVIEALESAYSTCAGSECGAGGTCGLGGLPPACVQGTCAGQAP